MIIRSNDLSKEKREWVREAKVESVAKFVFRYCARRSLF